ncbi:hypothetical protein DSM112329_01163 [Paraconexibacter sp. AEG42_29]|uniref:Uncharacterized protein n=1 Tax=Paraconexibacter sp. AEG42_29 TaxID=2997339 RepID=A0AAU7ARV4_9ACTN
MFSTSSPVRSAAILTALVGAALPAVAVPAASAATRTEATYAVTLKAQMTERWQYRYDSTDDCKLTGDMCTKTIVGSGAASAQLRTRSPQDVWVLRGSGGRPPALNTGTDGLQITGSTVRSGSLTTTYGGPWQAANRDVTRPTSGCGRRDVRASTGLAWAGRSGLQTSLSVGEGSGACPSGPGPAPDWKNDEAPSLSAVVAAVSPSKFLKTRQFTIRGTKTFTATYPTSQGSSKLGRYSEGGDHTVRWTWEATFRLKPGRRG